MIRNWKRLCFVLATVFLISCGKGGGGTPDPCSGVTITVNGTVTDVTGLGTNDGSISVTATGGSNFTFSINGGAFQSSGTFSALAAGNYNITAKSGVGCTGSKSFTVSGPDPCTLVNFTVSGTPTENTPCIAANGSITVSTNVGGTGFTYNINGGAFQSSPLFPNLAANTYTIGAKESNGCVRTTSVNVQNRAPGPLFAAVKTIINTHCATAACHSGGNPSGGISFTIECNIISFRDRIKVRAVDDFNTPNQMPPPPEPGLTLAQRNAIVNWINAGGGYLQ